MCWGWEQDFPRSGLPELTGEVALKSYAFADATAARVVVTQPDGGIALAAQDSRLTQVSYANGMLWTGAPSRSTLQMYPCVCKGDRVWWLSTALVCCAQRRPQRC